MGSISVKKEAIQGGYTLWARQTVESEIFSEKPHVWFKIWFYIVNRANHEDDGKFKRGECFLYYEWICQATGATLDQTKKALGFMRKEHQISTKRSTRGILITINKYKHFQDFKSYKKHQRSTREALEKHQRSTTINNTLNTLKTPIRDISSKEHIKQHITEDISLASDSEKMKQKTEIQEVVDFYKIEVEGVDPNDKKGMNHNYKRYVNDAKKLLEYFDGDVEMTKRCISGVSQEFLERELSFNISTIYRYADRWKRRVYSD